MLQNSILFVILLVLCFGAIPLIKKWFGKAGLFAWIAIASIVSNITAASVGPMFGLQGVTLANISFATVFLACQILTLCYGKEEGKKGVYVGLFSSVAFILLMMTSSYLIPDETDVVTAPIRELFAFGSYNMCNTVASVIMFFIANLMDVYVFDKLNQKLPEKLTWVSSIVACTLCNCLENFAFVLMGLWAFPNIVFAIFGTAAFDASYLMPIGICLQVALTTCIVEIVLGFLNGPMLAFAGKIKGPDQIDE